MKRASEAVRPHLIRQATQCPFRFSTGQFGKSHLGDKDEFLRTNHGFDEFFDTDRIMFLRSYLTQLQRATVDGVPVNGYDGLRVDGRP